MSEHEHHIEYSQDAMRAVTKAEAVANGLTTRRARVLQQLAQERAKNGRPAYGCASTENTFILALAPHLAESAAAR